MTPRKKKRPKIKKNVDDLPATELEMCKTGVFSSSVSQDLHKPKARGRKKAEPVVQKCNGALVVIGLDEAADPSSPNRSKANHVSVSRFKSVTVKDKSNKSVSPLASGTSASLEAECHRPVTDPANVGRSSTGCDVDVARSVNRASPKKNKQRLAKRDLLNTPSLRNLRSRSPLPSDGECANANQRQAKQSIATNETATVDVSLLKHMKVKMVELRSGAIINMQTGCHKPAADSDALIRHSADSQGVTSTISAPPSKKDKAAYDSISKRVSCHDGPVKSPDRGNCSKKSRTEQTSNSNESVSAYISSSPEKLRSPKKDSSNNPTSSQNKRQLSSDNKGHRGAKRRKEQTNGNESLPVFMLGASENVSSTRISSSEAPADSPTELCGTVGDSPAERLALTGVDYKHEKSTVAESPLPKKNSSNKICSFDTRKTPSISDRTHPCANRQLKERLLNARKVPSKNRGSKKLKSTADAVAVSPTEFHRSSPDCVADTFDSAGVSHERADNYTLRTSASKKNDMPSPNEDLSSNTLSPLNSEERSPKSDRNCQRSNMQQKEQFPDKSKAASVDLPLSTENVSSKKLTSTSANPETKCHQSVADSLADNLNSADLGGEQGVKCKVDASKTKTNKVPSSKTIKVPSSCNSENRSSKSNRKCSRSSKQQKKPLPDANSADAVCLPGTSENVPSKSLESSAEAVVKSVTEFHNSAADSVTDTVKCAGANTERASALKCKKNEGPAPNKDLPPNSVCSAVDSKQRSTKSPQKCHHATKQVSDANEATSFCNTNSKKLSLMTFGCRRQRVTASVADIFRPAGSKQAVSEPTLKKNAAHAPKKDMSSEMRFTLNSAKIPRKNHTHKQQQEQLPNANEPAGQKSESISNVVRTSQPEFCQSAADALADKLSSLDVGNEQVACKLSSKKSEGSLSRKDLSNRIPTFHDPEKKSSKPKSHSDKPRKEQFSNANVATPVALASDSASCKSSKLLNKNCNRLESPAVTPDRSSQLPVKAKCQGDQKISNTSKILSSTNSSKSSLPVNNYTGSNQGTSASGKTLPHPAVHATPTLREVNFLPPLDEAPKRKKVSSKPSRSLPVAKCKTRTALVKEDPAAKLDEASRDRSMVKVAEPDRTRAQSTDVASEISESLSNADRSAKLSLTVSKGDDTSEDCNLSPQPKCSLHFSPKKSRSEPPANQTSSKELTVATKETRCRKAVIESPTKCDLGKNLNASLMTADDKLRLKCVVLLSRLNPSLIERLCKLKSPFCTMKEKTADVPSKHLKERSRKSSVHNKERKERQPAESDLHQVPKTDNRHNRKNKRKGSDLTSGERTLKKRKLSPESANDVIASATCTLTTSADNLHGASGTSASENDTEIVSTNSVDKPAEKCTSVTDSAGNSEIVSTNSVDKPAEKCISVTDSAVTVSTSDVVTGDTLSTPKKSSKPAKMKRAASKNPHRGSSKERKHRNDNDGMFFASEESGTDDEACLKEEGIQRINLGNSPSKVSAHLSEKDGCSGKDAKRGPWHRDAQRRSCGNERAQSAEKHRTLGQAGAIHKRKDHKSTLDIGEVPAQDATTDGSDERVRQLKGCESSRPDRVSERHDYKRRSCGNEHAQSAEKYRTLGQAGTIRKRNDRKSILDVGQIRAQDAKADGSDERVGQLKGCESSKQINLGNSPSKVSVHLSEMNDCSGKDAKRGHRHRNAKLRSCGNECAQSAEKHWTPSQTGAIRKREDHKSTLDVDEIPAQDAAAGGSDECIVHLKGCESSKQDAESELHDFLPTLLTLNHELSSDNENFADHKENRNDCSQTDGNSSLLVKDSAFSWNDSEMQEPLLPDAGDDSFTEAFVEGYDKLDSGLSPERVSPAQELCNGSKTELPVPLETGLSHLENGCFVLDCVDGDISDLVPDTAPSVAHCEAKPETFPSKQPMFCEIGGDHHTSTSFMLDGDFKTGHLDQIPGLDLLQEDRVPSQISDSPSPLFGSACGAFRSRVRFDLELPENLDKGLKLKAVWIDDATDAVSVQAHKSVPMEEASADEQSESDDGEWQDGPETCCEEDARLKEAMARDDSVSRASFNSPSQDDLLPAQSQDAAEAIGMASCDDVAEEQDDALSLLAPSLGHDSVLATSNDGFEVACPKKPSRNIVLSSDVFPEVKQEFGTNQRKRRTLITAPNEVLSLAPSDPSFPAIKEEKQCANGFLFSDDMAGCERMEIDDSDGEEYTVQGQSMTEMKTPALLGAFQEEIQKDNLLKALHIFENLVPKLMGARRYDMLEALLNKAETQNRRMGNNLVQKLVKIVLKIVPVSSETLQKKVQLLRSCFKAIKNCISYPAHKVLSSEISTGCPSLTHLYNSILVNSINGDIVEVLHLYQAGKELGIVLDTVAARALLIMFHSAQVPRMAHELFHLCCWMGIYPAIKVNEWPNCLRLKSYYTEVEITMLFSSYLQKLASHLSKTAFFKDRILTPDEKYRSYINIEVVECPEGINVRYLRDVDFSLDAACLRLRNVLAGYGIRDLGWNASRILHIPSNEMQNVLCNVKYRHIVFHTKQPPWSHGPFKKAVFQKTFPWYSNPFHNGK